MDNLYPLLLKPLDKITDEEMFMHIDALARYKDGRYDAAVDVLFYFMEGEFSPSDEAVYLEFLDDCTESPYFYLQPEGGFIRLDGKDRWGNEVRLFIYKLPENETISASKFLPEYLQIEGNENRDMWILPPAVNFS